MSIKTEEFFLFIQGPESITLDTNIPLYIWSSIHSGNVPSNTITLFLDGDTIVNENLILFLKSANEAIESETLNLFISGKTYEIDNSIPLYINSDGADNSITLYIKAPGTTDKAVPYSDSIPLFIERLPSGLITLFLQAHGTDINDSIDLFIKGAYIINDSITLVIPEVIGVEQNTTTLFTRGF